MPPGNVIGRAAPIPMAVACAELSTQLQNAPGSVVPGRVCDPSPRVGESPAADPCQVLIRDPTPIKILSLGYWLQFYNDQPAAQLLLDGFKFEVKIPAPLRASHTFAYNLWSVRGLEDVVKRKIAKEVEAGRVVEPFAMPPLSNLQVSPLGLVPKKALGQFRLSPPVFSRRCFCK